MFGAVFLSGYSNYVKVWENSKKLWKHSPVKLVFPQHFSFSQTSTCATNLIETQNVFSIYRVKLLYFTLLLH